MLVRQLEVDPLDDGRLVQSRSRSLRAGILDKEHAVAWGVPYGGFVEERIASRSCISEKSERGVVPYNSVKVVIVNMEWAGLE